MRRLLRRWDCHAALLLQMPSSGPVVASGAKQSHHSRTRNPGRASKHLAHRNRFISKSRLAFLSYVSLRDRPWNYEFGPGFFLFE